MAYAAFKIDMETMFAKYVRQRFGKSNSIRRRLLKHCTLGKLPGIQRNWLIMSASHNLY